MSERDRQALTDELLVEEFKSSRDVRYFEELFARYRRGVYYLCVGFAGNGAVAEELVQEIFLRVYRKIDLFTGGSFRSWFYTLARRHCLNYLEVMPDKPVDDKMGEEAFAERIADPLAAAQVKTVLRALSPPQRICLKLFYIEGYTYKEIAKLTGYAEKEIKSHIQNGRRRFRNIWEDQGAGKKRGADD